MQSYIVVGQTVAIEQTLDADVPDDVNLVESHGRFHYLRPVQVDGLVSDSDHVRFHFSGPNGCRLEFSGQQRRHEFRPGNGGVDIGQHHVFDPGSGVNTV